MVGRVFLRRERSIQDGLEPLVGRVEIELQLSSLLWTEVFGGTHLVQRDEPLDNLALVLEITIGDPVHGLDGVDQDGMQRILGQDIHPDCIKQGDEVLRCGYDG